MKVNVGGLNFNIDQDFIKQNPQSIFAEFLGLIDEKVVEQVTFARSSELFAKILEFCRDRNAIKFSQMSHIDIDKILIEAKFFKIESLIKRCELESKINYQESLIVVETERKLKELLKNESRLVVIVDYCCLNFPEGADIKKALGLIDRDKCLMISCAEPIGKYVRDYRSKREGHYIYNHLLYDPKTQEIIESTVPTDLGRILFLFHYVERFLSTN